MPAKTPSELLQDYFIDNAAIRGDPDTSARCGAGAIFLNSEANPVYSCFGLDNHNSSSTKDTIFGIGSVTKVLTASILAQMTSGPTTPEKNFPRNLLNKNVNPYYPSLGKAIQALWPDCPFTLSEDQSAVLFTELASFFGGVPPSSGSDAPPPPKNQDEFVSLIDNHLAPPFPSTKPAYSNYSIGLIGQTLMGTLGVNYEQNGKDLNQSQSQAWYDDYLLTPLGMSSTSTKSPVSASSAVSYAVPVDEDGNEVDYEPWCPWGTAGRMYSTAADMINFVKANVGVKPADYKGTPSTQNVVSALPLAQKPPSFETWKSADNSVLGKFQYGFAWQTYSVVRGGTTYQISGKDGALAGVSAYVAVCPTLKCGVVLLVNCKGLPVVEAGENIILGLLPSA